MPNYGGLGLVQGIGQGLDDARAKMIQDQQIADREKQQQLGEAIQTKQENRAEQLFPQQLKDEQTRGGLLKTQADVAQQQDDLLKKTAPARILAANDDAKTAHNNAVRTSLNLSDEQFQRLHGAIYAGSRVLNDQVSNSIRSGGTQGVDPSVIEQTYNATAPKGQRIKPGTLQVIPDATNPGATVIKYTRDDGQPRTTTLAGWNQMAAAYIPPKQPVSVGRNDRLVDPTTGRVLVDTSPTAGIAPVNATGWSNSVSTQMAKNFGGMIDAQGNLTGLTNDTARTVGDLSGAAAAYGRATNYAVAPQTVAAAAKSVYDNQGIMPTDPKFMGALDAEVKKYQGQQSGGYGMAPQASANAPSSVGGLPNPLTQGGSPSTQDLLNQAKQAIQNGKDPSAVRQRLQQMGVSDADIQSAGL